jgi:DNA primase large subunit
MHDERKKDNLSHFILRLAYCKSEDLRRWFLQHECELFKYRFDTESGEDINKFLQANNMKYHPMPIEEKRALIPKLVACGFKLTEESVMQTDYFQVRQLLGLFLVHLCWCHRWCWAV